MGRLINTPLSRLTPDRQDSFLAALAVSGDVDHAAQAIDTTPGHVYTMRSRDQAFREAWAVVIERLWEKRIKQRAQRA